MTLTQKYKYTRIAIAFYFTAFLIIATIVAVKGHYAIFGILLLLFYLSSLIYGRVVSKIYLQMSLVKFIKSNGGSVPTDQARNRFTDPRNAKPGKEKGNEVFPELLESLLKDGVVSQESEIIKLNKNAM